MLSPVLESNGALGLGYALPALTITNVTGQDGQPHAVTGPADSASLAVAEMPGLFGARPAAVSAPARPLPALALAGLGCLVLVALAAAGLVLVRLRRRTVQ